MELKFEHPKFGTGRIVERLDDGKYKVDFDGYSVTMSHDDIVEFLEYKIGDRVFAGSYFCSGSKPFTKNMNGTVVGIWHNLCAPGDNIYLVKTEDGDEWYYDPSQLSEPKIKPKFDVGDWVYVGSFECVYGWVKVNEVCEVIDNTCKSKYGQYSVNTTKYGIRYIHESELREVTRDDLRYKVGDKVHVGSYIDSFRRYHVDKNGVVIGVYPTTTNPYLVKTGENFQRWYEIDQVSDVTHQFSVGDLVFAKQTISNCIRVYDQVVKITDLYDEHGRYKVITSDGDTGITRDEYSGKQNLFSIEFKGE